jgi:hypothetical protein
VGRSNRTDEFDRNFNFGEKWWLCGPNVGWAGQPRLGTGADAAWLWNADSIA